MIKAGNVKAGSFQYENCRLASYGKLNISSKFQGKKVYLVEWCGQGITIKRYLRRNNETFIVSFM